MNVPRVSIFAAFGLACVGMLTVRPAPARSDWGPDGVTVSASTAHIPLIEACSDGAYGNFVAWQETTTPILRVHHLLENGDLDPAWPAGGGVACSVAFSRDLVGVLPDRLGGLYAWWKEGVDFYATRLDASGGVAKGWPQRGRLLGSILIESPKPSVIEDGAHGFYAAWTAGSLTVPDGATVLGIHLSPDGTGAGGWPDVPLPLKGPDAEPTLEYWPDLALAPDGGVFVAWGSWCVFNIFETPSHWQARRLTRSGAPHPAWPEEGISFGSFHREILGPYPYTHPQAALLSIAPDDRGGFFAFSADPDHHPCCPNDPRIYSSLRRFSGSGRPAPGWPREGRPIGPASGFFYDTLIEGSYGVFADGRDGAILEWSEITGTDGANATSVIRCPDTGQVGAYPDLSGLIRGHQVVANGAGGAFLATFKASGPTAWYNPGPAYLRLAQFGSPSWVDWIESHPEPQTYWFGDIALAPSGDRGVVFFWSQYRDRIGLFARRFGPNGQVDVAPVVGPRGLRSLRFVSGVGVRASFDVGPARTGRFDLFDLAGRRLASSEVREAGEIVLPGTADLMTGIYFGRLLAGGERYVGRLAVTR